ncbi:putative leucine-rich repeat-containing protein DDB_G0290503 isoform X2 [Symsagittifera roscoffensis]|uniref:putative leucine-rich repeat-containing protein DDB_G0290503 isoform X2 n=1 Tax=Symsagittifera roscoffensis TaxID=84072 RepID=UPI00307BDC0C
MSTGSGSDEWEEVRKLNSPPPMKEITFFWFRDSDVILPAEHAQFSLVVLRLYAATEEIDVELRLDESTDVFESKPVSVHVGPYEGSLIIGDDSFYPLNSFEVFPNRNRVVLKINPDSIADASGEYISSSDESNNNDKLEELSENEQRVKGKQLLISVSDEEFRSSEDEDPTGVGYSSAEDEQISVSYVPETESVFSNLFGKNLLDEENRIEEEDDNLEGVDENEFEFQDKTYVENEIDTEYGEYEEIRLKTSEEDEEENKSSENGVNQMIRKYSKDSTKVEQMTSSQSNIEKDGSPKMITTPGRSTPSTVIDTKLSPVSTPRQSETGYIEEEGSRHSDLDSEIQELHRRNTEKDNEILRLKRDMLELQRNNRNLQSELEKLQQSDLDEIHNLQDENQRLELQISMLERDNRGQRKNDVDPKYDALLKEVEIQKRVICELEAEKEILDKKVESLQMSLNQSKTFAAIDEETEPVTDMSESIQEQKSNPLPQSNEDPIMETDNHKNRESYSPKREKDNHSPSNSLSAVDDGNRRSQIPYGIRQYMQNGHSKEPVQSPSSSSNFDHFANGQQKNGHQTNGHLENQYEVSPKSDDSFVAPDLSYTKSNISFLRERLGDLKVKNDDLHDRYCKLEESSERKREAEFGNMQEISKSKNPIEKFREGLLEDHAELLEATDKEIDRLVDRITQNDPLFNQSNPDFKNDEDMAEMRYEGSEKTLYQTPAGNMSRPQRSTFMEQRKAALADLEEIRTNLAAVREQLKNDEAKNKEFEWVRLRDNFDKLKRPSELFGSLIQLSDDKLSANQLSDLDLDPEDEKILKRALSDKHFNLNGVESTWSADKRSNDQLGKSGKYVSGHSSTAESIIERQIDKLNAASLLYNVTTKSYQNGAESDSTEVLLAVNPVPPPVTTIVNKPQSSLGRAISHRVKTSPNRSPNRSKGQAKSHGRRVRSTSRNSATSGGGGNKRQSVKYIKSRRSSSEDNESSDATIISDDDTANENGHDSPVMNRGTHRNPDSLYEERLNKSYPSGSATRSRLKANGLLVTDSETANDSESTLEAESICVSDAWSGYARNGMKQLPSPNFTGSGRSATQKRSSSPQKYVDMKRYSSSQLSNSLNSKCGSNTNLKKSSLDAPKFYLPKVPSDARKGDRVKFSRKGGKVSHGIIKYAGKLPGRNDYYLGVELEAGAGKHDGTYQGKRLFTCEFRKGAFVSFDKIILCYNLL